MPAQSMICENQVFNSGQGLRLGEQALSFVAHCGASALYPHPAATVSFNPSALMTPSGVVSCGSPFSLSAL